MAPLNLPESVRNAVPFDSFFSNQMACVLFEKDKCRKGWRVPKKNGNLMPDPTRSTALQRKCNLSWTFLDPLVSSIKWLKITTQSSALEVSPHLAGWQRHSASWWTPALQAQACRPTAMPGHQKLSRKRLFYINKVCYINIIPGPSNCH